MRRLVLALVPLLLAATWYVRKDGSDSLCSGQTDATGTTATSPLCAYRSVGKALSASSASDTITIHAGIYYESLLIDKALTIQGATGETVWIRAGSPATETAGNAAWTLVDATRGEYISTGTFPGFANDPFGFVMDVPGVMETGNFLGLVTYGDNRATTGKACRGGTRQGFVCTSDGSGTNGCPGCFPATGCCDLGCLCRTDDAALRWSRDLGGPTLLGRREPRPGLRQEGGRHRDRLPRRDMHEDRQNQDPPRQDRGHEGLRGHVREGLLE